MKATYIILIFPITNDNFLALIFLYYLDKKRYNELWRKYPYEKPLSTKVQRQLRLMETLIQNRNWMKLHELAEKLGCTERILKSDLNELRIAFPSINIQSSVNGIMIDLEVNTSVEDIYQYFLANSQSFQLLEYMFFNEGYLFIEQ